MTKQKTLSIVKPDAVKGKHIGEILARFEKAGLKIVAARMAWLTKEEAQAFYAVHAKRPFYNDLVTFMTEGPVLVTALEGEDAVLKNRQIMGATNPKDAEAGTIRKDFAESIDRNAVHGSDSEENAKIEISFFFKPKEIFSKSCSSCSCSH